jgi:putative transposase
VPATQALSARIIELAQVRRRFGYRRLHDLLRSEYPAVNHKKVYRLYRAASLALRRRNKARRPHVERQAVSAAAVPNAVWSMDFVSDALANGRRLKSLTVADDFTHECDDITVDTASAAPMSCVFWTRPRGSVTPRALRTDNGPGFTSRAFIA